MVLLAAIGSAVAAVLTLLPVVDPPDTTAATLGVIWIGLPSLLAIGLAVLGCRRRGLLVALLMALALTAVPGLYLYGQVVTEVSTARQEAATAVQPGEDPDRGPAGMRKAGADMGVFVTDGISLFVLAIVPPAQLVVVAIAAGVGALVSHTRANGSDSGRPSTDG
jgi:phosphotransferase system  glucose/maltose/N-acetylglucosamine-specific IIC component